MLQQGQAASRLKPGAMNGKSFVLNNGDPFVIPTLPLGPSGERFLGFLERSEQQEDTSLTRDMFREFFGLVVDILKLNYEITEEECDGLIGMQQFQDILSHFFGMSQENAGAPPTKAPAKVEDLGHYHADGSLGAKLKAASAQNARSPQYADFSAGSEPTAAQPEETPVASA